MLSAGTGLSEEERFALLDQRENWNTCQRSILWKLLFSIKLFHQ